MDSESETVEPSPPTDSDQQLRGSQRARSKSCKLKDYYLYNLEQLNNSLISNQDSQAREPLSYEEASSNLKWITVMDEELEALKKNRTWEIVELPKNKSTVGCKWTYKLKYNSQGKMGRYKARLVAKGYSQLPGIDFQETFTPVVKMTSIHILLAIAVQKNWKLFQMDVKNAFLYGNLNEEIYIELPKGLIIT